jgi:outer membrane protein OmpU
MNFRNALLGTTAILGATALVVPSAASAFEVNIRGFYNFNVVGGDLDEALGGPNNRRSFDFVTDSEIHVQGVNTDDETGIRYGFLVEFETDPQNNVGNNTGNAVIDENWIFIDGAFGGFRLGQEDGAVDNSKITAANIAAGTGGIDGQGVVGSVPFTNFNSGDSTKIRYDSPSIAGFTVHGSYTPNVNTQGNNVKIKAADQLEDMVETALVYTGSFGGLDLQAGGTFGFAGGSRGADDYMGFSAGAIVGFAGFRVAGSYYDDDDRPGVGDRRGYTLGAAASLGPANLSVTWADVFDADGAEGQNLVASASMGVLPGMSLHGDVSFFDRDVGGDDDGVTGVARLRVAF